MDKSLEPDTIDAINYRKLQNKSKDDWSDYIMNKSNINVHEKSKEQQEFEKIVIEKISNVEGEVLKMEFKEYESKPIKRLAFQINEQHMICKVDYAEAKYKIYYPLSISPTYVYFKAYESPKVGDWVVKLTEEDTYHCTDAVFRERNIVNEI